MPVEQQLNLAALNMVGIVEKWVISYMSIRNQVPGDDFVTDLYARFRDKSFGVEVERFNKLEQTGSSEQYLDWGVFRGDVFAREFHRGIKSYC